jgi:hypothetical protein
VCADIAEWKASGWAALPHGAVEFVARAEAIEAGSLVGRSEESRETVIRRLLKRYETPSQRRTNVRIERLEKRAGTRLAKALEAVRVSLAAALGASAL